LALPITQLDAPALVKPLSSYGVRIIGVNIFVIKVVVKSWLCVVELSTRSILSRNLDRSGGSAPSKKSVKPFDGGWREDKLGVIICSDVVCLLCDSKACSRFLAIALIAALRVTSASFFLGGLALLPGSLLSFKTNLGCFLVGLGACGLSIGFLFATDDRSGRGRLRSVSN
ncbi:unnamed protein product, partial [Mycena citricolor]